MAGNCVCMKRLMSDPTTVSQMHGPAVASIAVGKSVGVAPKLIFTTSARGLAIGVRVPPTSHGILNTMPGPSYGSWRSTSSCLRTARSVLLPCRWDGPRIRRGMRRLRPLSKRLKRLACLWYQATSRRPIISSSTDWDAHLWPIRMYLNLMSQASGGLMDFMLVDN